jgi:hypothetical protein
MFISIFTILLTLLYVASAQNEKKYLPSGSLNMGYASECNPEKIVKSVMNGVNVIFWFSIDLANVNGKPAIIPNTVQPIPSVDCIINVSNILKEKNLKTTHMVTIGGWAAQHPTTDFPASEMWHTWKEWNKNVIEAAGLSGGFDGIDWDMEGTNTPSDPTNFLAKDMMDLVGEISQLAKSEGYIVSMVPAESYLDPTTSLFDNSLLHNYQEWENVGVDFNYHGHNGYAYLLAKYGKTGFVDTFDIVTIQLYESYTHVLYNVTELNQKASSYLENWIPEVQNGFFVDFSSFPSFGIESQQVAVSKTVLCIGLGNGWADYSRNLLIMPNDLEIAYNNLLKLNIQPRGFAFWAIENEGDIPVNSTTPLFMAAGINNFLHTRN